MWNVFKEQIKFLTNTKWKLFTFILILIVPLGYGGILMAAFWNPLVNMQLKVYVVDKDTSDGEDPNSISKTLTKELATIHSLTNNKTNNIAINVSAIYDKNNDQNVQDNIKIGSWDAAFVIPQNYSLNSEDNVLKGFNNLLIANDYKGLKELIDIYVSTNKDFAAISNYIVNNLRISIPQIDFYNSYKNNFIVGEFTSILANIFETNLSVLSALFSTDSLITHIEQQVNNDPNIDVTLKQKMIKFLEYLKNQFDQSFSPGQINQIFYNFVNNITKHEMVGSNFSSYGIGISGYLISLGLWVGTIFMTFYYKNQRIGKQNRNNTFSNYFGRSITWALTGWIQAILMFGVITWLGVRSYNGLSGQWNLLIFMLFTSTIFSLFAQGISHLFRYGEIPAIIMVIFLIIQLTSSSGTFPVELESSFFQFVSTYIPFTYSVHGLRMIVFDSNFFESLKIVWPMFLFLLVIPVSLFVNWIIDKKRYNPETLLFRHENQYFENEE